MSEEDKISWREFADPLWHKMTDMMESGRGIPKGTMQKYGDSLWELSIESPQISEIALDLNLVDKIVIIPPIVIYFVDIVNTLLF